MPHRAQAHASVSTGYIVRTLVGLLDRNAREDPERLAFRVVQSHKAQEVATWQALLSAARRAAARLHEEGVRRRDRVLLILPTSAAFIEQFFGALLLGAIPVPLAPPYSVSSSHLGAYEEVLRAIATDCEPVACVSMPRLNMIIRAALTHGVPTMKLLVPGGSDGPCPTPVIHAGDTALLQYTSGSTSDPKAVELTHANILANIRAINKALDLTSHDVGVSWLPLYHDMGLIGTLLTAFFCRGLMVLLPPQAFVKNPMIWLKTISRYRATISVAPNFAFGFCVKRIDEEELKGVRLDSLRVLLNGAEPIDAKAVERFESTFRPYGLPEYVVRPVYGLAESTLAVTFSEPGKWLLEERDADELERMGTVGPRKFVPRDNARPRKPENRRRRTLISVGKPVPTQEVRIVDPLGHTLPEQKVGEIIVRGPSVMKGYFNRPEETHLALVNGWLHTGDWGFLSHGSLFVTGRKKDLIIRHGRNYYPQDIEFAVQKLEGVRKGSVAAFSIESDEESKLVVVVETALTDAQPRQHLEHAIREQVCHTFLFGPEDVRLVAVGAVAKTTSGKIRRQECKRRYLAGELGEVPREKRATLMGAVARSSIAYVEQLLVRARAWLRS